MQFEMVPIAQVVPTENTPLHSNVVKQAARLLRDAWDTKVVPPLLIWAITEKVGGVRVNRYYVDDGHHRLAAAIAVGYTEVPVLNKSAMRRGELGAYRKSIERYRALTGGRG